MTSDTRRLPVALLMGPTAAGKTEFAVAAAQHLPVDIISVDSAMVYRGMDIGTGKPSNDVLAQAPHQLVDIRDPQERYSAGDFVRDATAAILASHGAGRLPLLVGGTNLYFNALRGGLSAELPDAPAALRARLRAEGEATGWPAMHARLAAVDPVAARRMHPNDAQRIGRALEVYEVAGVPLSELQERAVDDPAGTGLSRMELRVAVVQPAARSTLHDRIARRLDAMLAAGFVEEVRELLTRPGMGRDLPSVRAVGYRQLAPVALGESPLAPARERALFATRQLAKRQLTWLRREEKATHLDSEARDSVSHCLAWLDALYNEGLSGRL